MFWRKNPQRTSENGGAPQGIDRRRSPRVETAVLSCELGQVLDISKHGVRLSVSRTPPNLGPGSSVGLMLSSPVDGIEVSAKVIRIRHVGYGRYEIALDFSSITEAEAVAIEALARTGSRRASLNVDAVKKERLVAALKLPDYYAALGVGAGASDEQVHQAFRSLARKYHPDICKDEAAQKRFVEINEAHTVLGDRDKRAEYDAYYSIRAAA